jgi:superfamily I DNA/RNA helicase
MGDKITLHAFDTDEEEARTIVEEIEFQRLAKRVPWGKQAILFRTNLQARPIETALRTARVRYHLIGGQSFFDRREVKDLLAYLRVMINPHDDVSFLRIANTPPRGLSDVTMERLLGASQERNSSVFAAMRHTDVLASLQARTRLAAAAFTQWIEETRAPLSGTEPVKLSEWAERFLTDCGYFADLRGSEKDAEAGENRVRNLREIIHTLDENGLPANKPMERLVEFLEEITLDSEREEDKEDAGDAVTLITMHSCKGLEYPHVYIVGLEDGLLPHSRSKVEGTLDEERRLFYVAITRAQVALSISHCAGRKKYGQVVPCHPSPFLNELPGDLVESAANRHKEPVKAEAGRSMFAAMKEALG